MSKLRIYWEISYPFFKKKKKKVQFRVSFNSFSEMELRKEKNYVSISLPRDTSSTSLSLPKG